MGDNARHDDGQHVQRRTLYAALAIATCEGETMEWLPSYDADDARAQPSTAPDKT